MAEMKMSGAETLLYLKRRASRMQKDIEEKTGVEGVRVMIEIFDHIVAAEAFSVMEMDAERVGMRRQEWSQEQQGGSFAFGDRVTTVIIYDSNMPHKNGQDSKSAE